MREWNASVYHRVSDPQLQWGKQVLERLPLLGHEVVMDVGCGSGRLAALLRDRLPRGRVIGVDLSKNMLDTARAYLQPNYNGRIELVVADATALPFIEAADAIFSTASFHWILDHTRLFESLWVTLRPGGRLVAQCGGGPNIQRLRARARDLMDHALFKPYFGNWRDPWLFADADVTARRLRDAGFKEVLTSLHPAPATMPDADAFQEFVAAVVYHQHLASLPTDELRQRFMDALTHEASKDSPPFELDYWRLNMEARK